MSVTSKQIATTLRSIYEGPCTDDTLAPLARRDSVQATIWSAFSALKK